MRDSVLLDTSFLISFADPAREHHYCAHQYFSYFLQENLPMWLSTIAASEFHLKQKVTDLPLNQITVLPFNLADATQAADLDFRRFKNTAGVPRDALKDDFKLLGQVKANQIGYLITEDARSLYRFCEELRTRGEIPTRAIKLEDGFDRSYFDPVNQMQLPEPGPG